MLPAFAGFIGSSVRICTAILIDRAFDDSKEV